MSSARTKCVIGPSTDIEDYDRQVYPWPLTYLLDSVVCRIFKDPMTDQGIGFSKYTLSPISSH